MAVYCMYIKRILGDLLTVLLRQSAAPIHTRSFVVSLVVRSLLVLSGCRILKKISK